MDWAQIVERIRELAAAPGQNMQLSIMLLVAAVLLVALLIVLLLLAVTLVRKPKAKAAVRVRKVRKPDGTVVVQRVVPKVVAAAPKPKRQLTAEQIARLRRQQKAVPWLIALVVAGAAVAAYASTSTRSFCSTSCHAASPAVASAAKDPHASVSCVSCHEAPLPLGVVTNVATRAKWAVDQARATSSAPDTNVDSSRCLACHSSIATGVTLEKSSGVRVSHKEPIAAGMQCSDCHSNVGHAAGSTRAPMRTCLSCHDGKQAPSKCSTCHVGDTSKAIAADRRDFTNKVRLGPVKDCGGCHSQVTCDRCHGLRMPHTPEFISYGHARLAAFQGKATCYRCHTTADCQRCHEPFATSGHPAGWSTAHRQSPTSSYCNCHQMKLPSEQASRPFCQVCHGPAAQAITH